MKSTIIEKLEAQIASELKPIDREARFDDMLDEIYSFEPVGGPFAHMSPSRVLRECDPVAHRCGVNDYADSEGWIEVDGEYYEQDECEEQKEALISELESEIADLEAEIEEATEQADALEESGEVADAAQVRAMIDSDNQKLAALNADLSALNSHSF